MPNETTPSTDPAERRGLTRRQKVAIALTAGALGVGGLTAKAVMDMDEEPVDTSTSTSAPEGPITPPPTISETPQSMEPTPSSTDASVSKNPTAMVPTPVEPTQPNKG